MYRLRIGATALTAGDPGLGEDAAAVAPGSFSSAAGAPSTAGSKLSGMLLKNVYVRDHLTDTARPRVCVSPSCLEG